MSTHDDPGDSHREPAAPDGPGTTPPPGAGFPPPTPRLVRRTDNAVIGGVASGLAAYFGVDPVIVRIGFVVLTFLGGSGVIAYGIAWLAMPEAGPQDHPPRAGSSAGSKQAVGVALVVAAIALLAGNVGWWRPGILWAFILIALGVVLFQQNGREWSAGGASHTGTATAPPPAQGRSTAGTQTGVPPGSPIAAPPPTGPYGYVPPPGTGAYERHAPEVMPGSAWSWEDDPGHSTGRTTSPSVLGRLTIGSTALALGVLAMLDAAGVAHPAFPHYIALALAVVGVGLLVGSLVGRARGLIVVGLLLSSVVLVNAAVDEVSLAGGVGERRWEPTSLNATGETAYGLGVGELVVDLTELPQDAEGTIRAHVGIGVLEVVVPEDSTVDVDAQVGIGEVDVEGNVNGGAGIDVTDTLEGSEPAPLLELDLDTGIGEIAVRRAME